MYHTEKVFISYFSAVNVLSFKGKKLSEKISGSASREMKGGFAQIL